MGNLPTLAALLADAPDTMWVETFRRLHFDALARARNAGVRVTALGPLVDDGCPACHHPDHDPGSCEWCPRCELHTDDALAWLLRIEPELAAGVQVAAPPSDAQRDRLIAAYDAGYAAGIRFAAPPSDPAAPLWEALIAALTDLFPRVERARWPFTVEQAADALRAALAIPAPASVRDVLDTARCSICEDPS